MGKFDFSRLHPIRVIGGIKRRFLEVPHSVAWRFSRRGKLNSSNLLGYKDKHKGETLYLLANGPSINRTKLKELKGKRVMCMNRFYIKFDDLGFLPDYLVCIEETVLSRFSDDFSKLPIPIFINWRMRDEIPNGVYLKESFNLMPFFQKDLSKPANSGGTVTFICLQLAYFMGFSKVIILGMDHSFSETGVAGKAEVRKYEKDESHFDPNYFPKGMKWIIPDLIKSELSYSIARSEYEKDERSILDATIDGKCTIFKKVDAESIY